MKSYSDNAYDVTIFCCLESSWPILPRFTVVRCQMAELNLWGVCPPPPLHYRGMLILNAKAFNKNNPFNKTCPNWTYPKLTNNFLKLCLVYQNIFHKSYKNRFANIFWQFRSIWKIYRQLFEVNYCNFPKLLLISWHFLEVWIPFWRPA